VRLTRVPGHGLQHKAVLDHKGTLHFCLPRRHIRDPALTPLGQAASRSLHQKNLLRRRFSVDSRRMDQPDQLRELFRMQKSLNERIGVQTDEMSDEQKTEWVLNYCRAMGQEIAELTDSVPWKWWAKYQKLDEQNARVEVVDLFHFLISLAQVLGMSADDIFAAYVKKNEVNFQRQDSGYTEKNEDDSRHI
jgi:dimeric dUTPase (all-alpha-NTP-PPase superfamily)